MFDRARKLAEYGLHADEVPILEIRPSWRMERWRYVMILVGGFQLWASADWVMRLLGLDDRLTAQLARWHIGWSGADALLAAAVAAIVLVAAGRFVGATLPMFWNDRLLTDRRIIVIEGIFDRQSIEVPLSRLETVEIVRPFALRLFGAGHLVLSGTGSGQIVLHEVHAPIAVRNAIMALLEGR
jgi:hypothetical protein